MQGFYNGKTDKWIPDPFTKYKHHPDAAKHQLISFIKSGIRIVGYIWLPINIIVAAAILLVSEIIGIYEELV
jgi:hypothetical protein